MGWRFLESGFAGLLVQDGLKPCVGSGSYLFRYDCPSSAQWLN